MSTRSFTEAKRQWDTVGWCVVEDVIPPDVLAAAQEAVSSLFPTAEAFAADVDPDRNRLFREGDRAPTPEFPFERGALNRVVLHDAMLDLAEALLGADAIRLYQAMALAKYANAATDHEQLLHADYANHTLVVPRTDPGYQHLETFVYLSDVAPDTGATRFVSREHTTNIPVERTYLHPYEYADLYAREEPACGPAGSVLVYRPDVYHRGVVLTRPGAARFMMAVAFKPVGTDWIGFHAWPVKGEDMAWHRFVPHATERQLTVLGFPPPGDGYWTDETLAGVAARYPALDMTPWRRALC
jgi:ectoine hydroxylase-related dioxygenase (phytanoyl-CoA dioxygenase family)